ncbi:MAG: 2-amino-4-hydroxy-6-hydroxymethyldihydropteridine diphosphokinase [Rhodoferax sp.]|nr:2-amino-4-hydroxy-6-hydroxymethyldihydropteridine diphosphokinase [Rhodoferax sp.]
MRPEVRAFIGLGANLGDAQATLDQAMDAIAALPGCRLAARSPQYRSAPLEASGPDYVNAVVEVATTLSAPELLQGLMGLEQQAGRERPYRNAPRTLDLDLLLYGDARMDSPSLTLPHPRMAQRAFVLRPLADVAPDRVDPERLRAVADQVCERR